MDLKRGIEIAVTAVVKDLEKARPRPVASSSENRADRHHLVQWAMLRSAR